MEKEKKKFYAVKEFNTWSQKLGWEEFKKEYDKKDRRQICRKNIAKVRKL